MSYPQVEIGTVVTLKQGFAINKNTKHHMSDEITTLPLLRIADMKDGSKNVFVKDTIPSHFIAKPNDIIYTRTGQVGLVFTNQFGVVHNNCFTVTSNDEQVLAREYLYYALKNGDFYIKANNLASGAAQPDLPHSAFNTIDIYLPPICIQKKIADILSVYDKLIDNNQKQIKLFEEAAQRLYKEWFIDLRFPGHETTPIVDGIPQGWEWLEFSEVFDYVRGKSYTSKELSDNEGVLMVNLKNIRAYGGYNRKAEKRFIGICKEAQLLASGDVVMGVTDMTQERRLVGHVALIPSFGEKATFSMDLIKLIPLSVSRNFLYCALQYGGYSDQIAPLANGVNVLHLKPDAMMKMKMLVPQKNVIDLFDNYFEPIRLKIECLQNQMELAEQSRDRLLPKLMSGEIEV